MKNVYDMAIANLSNYFKAGLPKDAKPDPNVKAEPVAFDVFEAASVLSVVFCKAKEEIVMDVMNAQK